MAWTHLLDRAYSLTQLAELEAWPGAVAEAFAAEVPAVSTLDDLVRRDALFADALARIDTAIARAMRIRLDHALADDTSIGPPTRNVFATTIVKYADDIGLLAERARDVAARGRARDPDDIAERVAIAARSVLALRTAIRDGVLAVIRDVARATVTDADRCARDPKLGDYERKRWSAIRRDLEATAANPTHVLAGPMAERLAALPEQLDDPAPGPEPTLAELIELD